MALIRIALCVAGILLGSPALLYAAPQAAGESTPTPPAETTPTQPTEPPSESPSQQQTQEPPPQLVPPVPSTSTEIPYPADAPAHSEPYEVTVVIRVDSHGQVSEVRLLSGVGDPFDSAVLEGATYFRFEPARYGGEPVEVEITFRQQFLPPPAAVEAEETGIPPESRAQLTGMVAELGTRRPVVGATVAAIAGDDEYLAETDEKGRFTLEVPAGELEIRIGASDFEPFVQKEKLAAKVKLNVKYLLRRTSYDPYETVVVGKRERREISRTTLEDREIKRIPGTFGDPFRVISVMPGVTQAMGLVPLPVVRGSSPGNTGFLLDGIQLPMLFHLFAGPSVVHPEMIDRVDFYPGCFPVNYGGFVGGIVDGHTRPARSGESAYEIDLNLTQTGLFVREDLPSLGITATAAGRIGYPGVLLSLLSSDVSLSYWDYQARLDSGTRRDGWSIFLLGADDHVEAVQINDEGKEELVTVMRTRFHRLDLGYRHGGEIAGQYRLALGVDESNLGGQASRAWVANPRLEWQSNLDQHIELRFGLQGSFNHTSLDMAADDGDVPDQLGFSDGPMYVSGAYLELLWKALDERLWLLPGARIDLYSQGDIRKGSFDPRLLVRYLLSGDASDGIWLKGGTGLYHQPPRSFIPIPGIDLSALEMGLLESWQSSLGVELAITEGISLDLQTYYNATDPVLFDLIVNPDVSQVATAPPSAPPGEMPPDTGTGFGFDGGPFAEGIFEPQVGRSYGLEILLRKRDQRGVFGWLAYTLSHSQRQRDGAWIDFDFDRRHIFNAVAGIRLPRNWEIGMRALYQTGTPLTTIYGSNIARTDAQFRFDIRIDKRAIWNNYLLDFYVDVINVTVAEESGGMVGAGAFRYLLPTVGFRGVI